MFSGIDVDFKLYHFSCNQIVERLNKGLIKYKTEGVCDARIIEFLMLLTPLDPIIARYNKELSIRTSDYKFDPGYTIYNGNGLIRALKYYIIDDNPLTSLMSMHEFEGLKFSELSSCFRRRVLEHQIDFIIDNAFYNENNDVIVTQYVDVLNNCK